MRKMLIVSNVFFITIILGILFKKYIYNPYKYKPGVSAVTDTAILKIEPPCLYSLKHFDFHFKNETKTPNVIMLGNSLIRWGNWDSLLTRHDVLNRGISGDNLRCICQRLSYLDNYKIKVCFIEGGINDIPGSNIDTLFKYYIEIVNYWKEKQVIPVMNFVLYISPRAGAKFPSRTDYKLVNSQVKTLNEKLFDYATKNKIKFIDLRNALCDKDNLVLLDKYTIDGVHLTASGYHIWADSIKSQLKVLGI